MRNFRKSLCIILSVLLVLPFGFLFAGAAQADYVLVSPYADVVWDGEDAWSLYKGNLHTHSTYSDAELTYEEMITEHYNQNFDFLGFADHGLTGKAWNEDQTRLALYTYQYLLGFKMEPLSDEQYAAITTGTQLLPDGTARAGMTEVIGAQEFNYLNITKSHVNGYFLPEGCGDGLDFGENGYEKTVAFIEKNGGLSHINHPGDWYDFDNEEAAADPENAWFLSEILLKYDSCLGIEVFNCHNGTEEYTRILWDTMLMQTLPYGKMVWGFANNDAHYTSHVDTSFMLFAMEENNVENIKKTMQNGAFFSVARRIFATDSIGPEQTVDATCTDIAYPVFTSVKTEDHTISVTVADCNYIQWIANGKVIASQDLSAEDCNGVISLNLDEIENAEDFLYVRAEILGDGGMTATQPIVIDNGSEKLTYEETTDFDSILSDIAFKIKSSRIYVLISELIALIVDEISDLINK